MGVGAVQSAVRQVPGNDCRQVQLAGEADDYGLDPICADGENASGLSLSRLYQAELGQVEESAVLGECAGGGERFCRCKSGQRSGRTKIPIIVQPDIFPASQGDPQVGHGLVACVGCQKIIKSLPIHVRRDVKNARLIPASAVGHTVDEEGRTACLLGDKGDAAEAFSLFGDCQIGQGLPGEKGLFGYAADLDRAGGIVAAVDGYVLTSGKDRADLLRCDSLAGGILRPIQEKYRLPAGGAETVAAAAHAVGVIVSGCAGDTEGLVLVRAVRLPRCVGLCLKPAKVAAAVLVEDGENNAPAVVRPIAGFEETAGDVCAPGRLSRGLCYIAANICRVDGCEGGPVKGIAAGP